nr:hypothetical protein BaRGS_032731 [Batillaria attramentaria]
MPDDSPVILDHVYTNEGGAYSPTTGVFTVPVNGTYILFTAVGTDTASRFSEAYLMVDNIWVCDTYSKDKGDYQSSSCQAVVHLVKGQKVWMRANGNSYFYTSLTSFSGVLVLPDM